MVTGMIPADTTVEILCSCQGVLVLSSESISLLKCANFLDVLDVPCVNNDQTNSFQAQATKH